MSSSNIWLSFQKKYIKWYIYLITMPGRRDWFGNYEKKEEKKPPSMDR